MNEELQNALADLIAKSISVAGDALAFTQEQLPEVVQQLLLWKMVFSAIWFGFGLLLIIAPPLIFYIYGGVGRPINPEAESYYRNHRRTLSHDEHGNPNPETIAPAIVVMLILLVLGMCAIDFDWLKILLAPKVYLIEYAASLAK